MSIAFKKTVAVLDGHCTIEDAESLLAWLLEQPGRKLNLKKLCHPHTAVLQVLMAVRPPVSVWPADASVNVWLQPSMSGEP